jgi:hypothetical protein
MENALTDAKSAEPVAISWKQFLESEPPGNYRAVETFVSRHNYYWMIHVPTLHLHCASSFCGGMRSFVVITHGLDPSRNGRTGAPIKSTRGGSE